MGQMQFGIIGYPLGHSFSPGYFNRKFKEEKIDAIFDLFPIPQIGDIRELISSHPALCGLSVTIPYKQQVIPYLDEIDAVAREVGAVNCISVKNGFTKGYNTDIAGFRDSLIPLLKTGHKQALILGTGGASHAVAYVLRELGINYQFVSRSKKESTLTYSELTENIMAQYQVVINTTPLGMYPNTDNFPPIPYQCLSAQHLLYDLVYNPGLTRFLSLGQEMGAVVKNGLEMLHLQAEKSWKIWTQ